MKRLWHLILALAVFGDCQPLEKRQQEYANLLNPALNPLVAAFGQKSFKKEYYPSKFPVKGAKKVSVWYGPYKVRPANSEPDVSGESPMIGFSMDPSGTGWTSLAMDFPKDITILKTSTSVVLEDGKKADISSGLFLHHLLFFDVGKQYPSMAGCYDMPVRRFPLSLFMAGSEDIGEGIFTTADGKFNSGYYVGQKDSIMMAGDVVNLRNETRYVYTKADIEYVEGKPPGMMEASIQMLNVGECDGSLGIFNPPENQKKFSINGTAIDIVSDGYVITSRGHLHDGGQDIIVKINGKEACISKAEYGGPGATRKAKDGTTWTTVREMTYCPGPLKVKRGDKISLEARYDFEAHPPRKQMSGELAEEMALVTFFFASSEEQQAQALKAQQALQAQQDRQEQLPVPT